MQEEEVPLEGLEPLRGHYEQALQKLKATVSQTVF